MAIEVLERRELLAADYLYSLEARPGVPNDGFGFSHAANDQFHVVANYRYPELNQPGFHGEIQVHDANTGVLLRTIQNPLPYELSNGLSPNGFGYAVDVQDNLILVGSPGWEGIFVHSPNPGAARNTGGRAFLFDANTGNLLETFDGTETYENAELNNDGFGRSVSIDGSLLAIAAYGPRFEDPELAGLFDDYPGYVYLFSTTGNIVDVIEDPLYDQNPSEIRDFGTTVALSDGKLVVTQGTGNFSPFGPTLIYEAATSPIFPSQLLHTLSVNGSEAVSEGNSVAIFKAPGTTHLVNATTGAVAQTFPGRMYDFDGSLIVSGPASGDPTAFPVIRDFPSGNVLFSVPTPPNFVETYFENNQIPQIFDDRLLVPGRQGSATNNVVFVYSVADGPSNGPPTDIALTNNSIAENSANNTVIGTLSAADPTPGETFTFSLINSAGGRFSISGTQLRVANGSLLDFETNTSHNVTVQVTDSAGNTYSEVLTIQVTNIHEPTDIALSPNSVLENSANGTIVGTLTATDLDPGETFTFALLTTAGGRFALVGNQIVVANGSALNFEANAFHNVMVQVSDSTGNSYSELLAILVTNVNEPITDLFLLDHKVVEQSPNGALIGAIDNPSPALNDAFGNVAATSTRLLVASSSAPEAYILDATSFEVLHTFQIPNSGGYIAVAISDTYAVVGAPFDNTNGTNAGAVHIYDVATGALVSTLYAPDPNSAWFGERVSILGNRLAVGGAFTQGQVSVYDLPSLTLTQTLVRPPASPPHVSSIAMTASNIFVGRANTGVGITDVYSANTGAFLFSIDNASPNGQDLFGHSSIATENRILIGAPLDDTAGPGAGAVYLFDASTGSLLHTFLPTGDTANGSYGFSLGMTNSRIAIGSNTSSRVYFYDATTFALIQELPGVHFGNEGFGVYLGFGGDRLFVGDYSTRGAYGSGEIQVFDAMTGDLLPSFRVTPEDFADTYSYTLLDDAGGRFAISGNQLVVASGAIIDFETATSHTVTVQVTDAGGSSLTKPLTINVIDANEPPTDIGLSNSNVLESSVRLLHNVTPMAGQFYGQSVAIYGNLTAVGVGTLASNDLFNAKVHVYDSTTGELVSTLLQPNPGSSEAFGSFIEIEGNLAVVAAPRETVSGFTNNGQVYVFNATSGALLHVLNDPTPKMNALFGNTIAISGNLIAVASEAGFSSGHVGEVHLFDALTGALLETIDNPNPTANGAFGNSVAINGSTIAIGAAGDDFGATNSGRAYLYNFNEAAATSTLTTTLNNPSVANGDFFGGEVDISDDWIVVAASREDTGATDAGTVYVFDRLTGALRTTINNPQPGTDDLLGTSLAIVGNKVIASSFLDEGSTGSVFVFDANSGALLAKVKSLTPQDPGFFGTQLAAFGDRIVVGSLFADTDDPQIGSAYIFDLNIGQAVGTLSSTDPDSSEIFTYSLTNNSDGRFAIQGNQIVIADATKLDFEAATSHTVTVQVTDGGGNTFSKDLTITVTQFNEPPQDMVLTGNTIPELQVRFLHNLGPQAIPSFGYVTAADGDLVVVGHNNLPVHNLLGEVSVYNRTTGALVSVLSAPSPQLGELFGETVAISGDRVVVGARLRNTGVGVAYVFNATTGALLHTLNNPTPASSGSFPDYFGSAVAISGNLIAIGTEEDLGAPDSGAVYLFDAVTGNLLQTIASPIPSIQSKFGNDLSLVGNTLVVGASLGNRAYIFEWNSANQSAVIVASLNVPPGGGGADFFGGAVTIVGNVVAVGASNSDAGASNSGQVHLFDRTTGSFLSSLNNPSPNANDNFGQVVAGNDTYLAVAAQNDDTDAVDSGRVYVFNPTTGELLSTIANPSPNVGDFFSRLSFAGNTLVVGAPTDDSDGFNAGMVYLFDLPIDQAVGSLATTDPDSGDSHTYALVNDADGRFGLVGNQIVVVDPSRLNFEVEASHSLTIQSTDSSGLSTYESFIIQVTNVNEPTTNINFAGNSVNEIAVNGTVVSTLSASDPDAGSTITYSLDNNAAGRFAIAGNTIVVANSALLDFETSSSHTVTVRATDNGGKFVLETLKINVIDAPEVYDFGDLPNSFGTTLAANGARHMLINNLRLGATVSSEANGQPSADANIDPGDDGVTLPFLLVPGLNATTTIAASQSSRLDAFIDFNGNGAFTESERITPVGGLLLNAGANTFTFAVPSSANSGNQGARFRISTLGGLSASGLASDGEVEDYRINILVPNLLSSQILADPEFPGLSMLYVKGSSNDDVITVNQNGGGLRATINGVQGAVLFPTSRVVIFGLGGDDDLRINGTTLPGYIDGGPDDDIIRGGNGPDLLFGRGGDDTIYGRNGDDTIYGGNGNDILESNGGIGILFGEGNSDTLTGNGILVGGNGSDELIGTGARNVLIGGNGADFLTGANANQGDIIIAGITIYDSNLIALKAIRDEWKEPTPVNNRINHLNGSTPGGLNDPYYLNIDTVFLDDASDTIINFGSTNPTRNDWIFKSPNDIKVNPPGIVVTILNPPPPAMLSLQSSRSSILESGAFNSDQPSDVDGDGLTTPLDVLMIVNHLNKSRQSPVVNGLDDGSFLDTNDDGSISPLDALVVINRINRSSRTPPDVTPDDSQVGDVDSVFGLLSGGEADSMDFWAGTESDLESSIQSLPSSTPKRRRK